MAVDLQVASKEYFSNLNSLAKKISVDVKHTQEAYQEFWLTLSKKDQEQVINESIICPAAVIKYAHLPPVVRTNPHTYSWFTKSQLDLFNQNRFFEEPSIPSNDSETTSKLKQSKKGSSNEKLESNKIKDSTIEKPVAAKLLKLSVLKPKIPPPPPPSKNCVSSAETELLDNTCDVSNASDIPKTGFDFLDNW